MSKPVIETKDLTKKYGDFVAVDGLNLTVNASAGESDDKQPGVVFGLLGPNGAGKTTTILMLLGLTEPSSGSVRVLGFDPARQTLSVKARVGYIPDMVGFYDELTARENLVYIGKLNGIRREQIYERIDQAIQRVGLSDVADHPVGTFSRGMRQRLGVADVLIKQPQLIIMDEPTQGLDPEGARAFLTMIRSLKEEGITILLSSHLLHQVQAVCDRVGLFYRGKMVLEGTVEELARRVLGIAYRIYLDVEQPTNAVTEAFKDIRGVVGVKQLGATSYHVEATSDLRAEAAAAVVKSGGRLLKLDVEAQSLDDIYARYFEEVNHDAAS